MSQLKATIRFCGLYEAELLTTLMLKHWDHPLAGDDGHANYLVEAATEILMRSQRGQQFIENIRPEQMNFVAAVWCAESCQIEDPGADGDEKRREWLSRLRHALPSCFCDPDDLL